tara:strand:+ start:2453 stop:3508 length:1056 start_codon:yes stop_codon:yes gene_type:complete
MSGRTIIHGKTTTNKIVPIQCNTDGTLEMTAEIDSSALAKETTLESLRTENASNLGTIAATLDDGTQLAKCMGSEDGTTSGTQKQIHLDGSGNVLVKEVGTVNVAPANNLNSHITDDPTNSVAVGLKARTTIGTATTEQFLLCDSAGHLQTDIVNTANVKFEDISSSLNSGTANDPPNSLAVGLRARTDIADAGTETFLKCDAAGVLQTSGSGGGGSSSSTYTLEQQSAATGTLQIIGDGSGNQYIDTNGGSKFVVVVQTNNGAGSPTIQLEWSDNTSFSVNQVFVCNGFFSGLASTTPLPLQASTRIDSSTLTTQAIVNFDTIPARYVRITVLQSSGSAITYTGKTALSP